MTARSRTYLKGRFENGDIPDGADYADLIDSFVNLEASATETTLGSLTITQDLTVNGLTTVSANITGGIGNFATVSAQNLYVTGNLYKSYADVSALGTTQGSAATFSSDTGRVFVTDAAERAIVINEHIRGREQRILGDSANVTAATVFPPSGFSFVGTAENAGILLAANETLELTHFLTTAIAYQRY